MKYWISYTLTIILIGVFFSFIYYIFNPHKFESFTSPVPDYLLLKNNNQVTLLDFWSPIFETFAGSNDLPEIQSKSALIYDLNSNKPIYEKNSKKKLPMASLTKIMTAVITLEDKSMPETYSVSKVDLVGEDSMGLTEGELLTKEELLYGLMLNSGNDASEVLARNYPQGREGFIKAMHDKAKALGLSDTTFSNPSGLQGDGIQYTTAYDLLILTKYAIDNFPFFIKVTSTFEHHIPQNTTHKEYYLTNETNLLSTYEGVKGVKTGFTPEAGMCLVTYYEKDGVRLIGILLNSPDRRGEMRSLLDYSLKTLGQFDTFSPDM